MATIINVHGTNDTGLEKSPVSGDGQWWQKDSYFEHHMRELLEADDGELVFISHVWDGKNSEASRWNAGKQLLKRVRILEGSQTPYILVGHSHGGSVIGHCLENTSLRKNTLQHLQSWITVGTPFIKNTPQPLLFNRLSMWSKSAFVLFSAFLLWLLTALIMIVSNAPQNYRLSDYALFGTIYILFAIPFYIALRRMQPEKIRLKLSKIKLRWLEENFAENWISLRHSNDEAVQGLQIARKIEINPVEPQFLTNSLLVVVLAVFLFGMVMAVSSKALTIDAVNFIRHLAGSAQFNSDAELQKWLNASIPAFNPDLDSFAFRLFVVVGFVLLLPGVFLAMLQAALTGITIQHAEAPGAEPYIIIGSFIFLFVGSLLLVWMLTNALLWILRLIARSLSSAISIAANRLVRAQLIATSLGDDFLGESGQYAQPHPTWTNRQDKTLPPGLESELTDLSNSEFSKSVEKFRKKLSELSMAISSSDPNKDLLGLLTWKELIHTAYFHVPRFRKLLAYAISQNDGFRPTDAFKADPDYQIVASWYDELKQHEAVS